MRVVKLLFVLASLLCAAISSTRGESVWIVSNGFHSSIGLRVRDLVGAPEWAKTAGANFVLVGWGDAQWYRGNVNAGTFCSALFWPTPSVLHVVPVRTNIARQFAHSDLVRIDLPHPNFARLQASLDAAFARDPDGRLIPVGNGFVPGSRFFRGRETFYFPKMCNYWVAEQLQKSGLRVSRFRAVSAAGLIHEAAAHGRREAKLGTPKDYF